MNEGSNKKTMQFQLDGNTQVQGRVGVGTEAAVEYQVTPDGKYLALTIAPRGVLFVGAAWIYADVTCPRLRIELSWRTSGASWDAQASWRCSTT